MILEMQSKKLGNDTNTHATAICSEPVDQVTEEQKKVNRREYQRLYYRRNRKKALAYQREYTRIHKKKVRLSSCDSNLGSRGSLISYNVRDIMKASPEKAARIVEQIVKGEGIFSAAL